MWDPAIAKPLMDTDKIKVKILESLKDKKNYSIYKVEFDNQIGTLHILNSLDKKPWKKHLRFIKEISKEREIISVGVDYILSIARS